MRRIGRLLVCSTLLAVSLSGCVSNAPPAPPDSSVPAVSLPAGETRLLDTTGGAAGNKLETASFTAPHYWSLSWAYNCGSGLMGFNLALIADAHDPLPDRALPNESEPVDSGVDFFNVGGHFHFELSFVDCPWHLVVGGCATDCGNEPQRGGVTELSGATVYDSRLITLTAETEFDYSFDCAASPNGVFPDITEGLRIQVPTPKDPTQLEDVLTSARDVGSGVVYLHNATPRADQLVVTSACPWHVRVGPRGSVPAFAAMPTGVPPPLPAPPPGRKQVFKATGWDSGESDLFEASGPVVITWSWQCDLYATPLVNLSLDSPSSSATATGALQYLTTDKRAGSTSIEGSMHGTFFWDATADSGCGWSAAVYT